MTILYNLPPFYHKLLLKIVYFVKNRLLVFRHILADKNLTSFDMSCC